MLGKPDEAAVRGWAELLLHVDVSRMRYIKCFRWRKIMQHLNPTYFRQWI